MRLFSNSMSKTTISPAVNVSPPDLKQFEIRHSDLKYDKKNEIGRGAFGNVFLGTYQPRKLKVAIKKLHSSSGESTMELYKREIEILASVRNVYCLELVGFTKEPPLCIVSKYVENGSLYKAIHNENSVKLTPEQMSAIAYGIASGIQYLHSLNIIHRDLKPQNILLGDNYIPVICDFGSSRSQESSQMTGTCGTPCYMAPEFYKGEYDEKVDVYSYSMILYEMITGKVPFDTLEPSQIIYKVLVAEERPELPEDTPKELEKLIHYCWSPDPSERPSFKVIADYMAKGQCLFKGAKKKEYFDIIHSFENIDSLFTTGKSFSPLNASHKRSKSIALPNVKPKRRSVSTSCYHFNSFGVNETSKLLLNLNSNDEIIIRKSLSSLEKLSDYACLDLQNVWESLFNFIENERNPIDLIQRVESLMLKFAKIKELLKGIEEVNNLSNYVSPKTLDCFLYFIEFYPNVIDKKCIDALIQLIQDDSCGIKATKLLCKYSMNSDLQYSKYVIDYFLQNCTKFVDDQSGYYIVRLLTYFNVITPEIIKKYGQSNIENNIISAYTALFSVYKKPDVFLLYNILSHVKSENETLRNHSLDFIRRYGGGADGKPLQAVLEALLYATIKYNSEKAGLLLSGFASDPNKCIILLQPPLIDILLNAPIKATPILLKSLVVASFTHEKCKQIIFSKQQTALFLTNVFKSSRIREILSVCLLLKKIHLTPEFIGFLASSEFVNEICIYICKYTDPYELLPLFSVLNILAPLIQSSNYNDVVDHLLLLVKKNVNISLQCIIVLSSISTQKSTHNIFLNNNYFSILQNYEDDGESIPYKRKIFKNLQSSSSNFN